MGVRGQDSSKRLPRHIRNEDLPTDTFTPHTYQVELLDLALHQNTVVCLGSGYGKTFIAIMLMKEMSTDAQRPLSDGGKRSIYLVSSVPLVEQQAQGILHHTDLRVGQYTPDMNVANWSHDRWLSEIDSHNALVMTADICSDLLLQGFLSLVQVNLLIMDDCQHVLQEHHPYVEIMEKYNNTPTQEQPRLLGMTSLILSGKCSNPIELKRTILSLENALKSAVESSTLVISERYGVRPKELVLECNDYVDTTGSYEEIEYILDHAVYFLDECKVDITEELDNRDPIQIPKTAITQCHNVLQHLGPWCAACIADMLVAQLEKIEKQKEFIVLHKKFLKFGASQLRMVSKVFEEKFQDVDYSVDELLLYTTPKVRELLTVLGKYRPETDFVIISEDADEMMGSDSDMSDSDMDLSDADDDDTKKGDNDSMKQIHVAVRKYNEEKMGEALESEEEKFLCGIVFVENQYVAYALNKIIEEACAWDEYLCFIKSSHISGHRVHGPKKEGQMQKKQEAVLRKFRVQELNLLVSTNVLEEGVDLPKCNLIVRFDVPKDYRSYSQSKGRARARDAEFVLLIEEENSDEFETKLKMYKDIEKVLIGNWKKGDDETLLEENIDDLLPPYVLSNESAAPRVTLSSAISLVNRYCAKLPSDAFTHLTPNCCVQELKGEKGQQMFEASLRLPINSPIKEEVVGAPMSSRMLAKRAVALKMCEILHKQGELDENLQPIGKEMFQLEDEAEWEEEEDLAGQARPGTTKRKQYYSKMITSALTMNHPRCGCPCNIYVVKMVLTGAITDDQNTRGRKIYAPEDSPRCLGILTSKDIPLVPLFPVYTRSGEVTVSVDLLKSGLSLSEEQVQRLVIFHKYLFSSVLRLEKDPMDFSFLDAQMGYLVIPLNTAEDDCLGIDWAFTDKVEQSHNNSKRTGLFDSDKNPFQFMKEDFEDAVVMPSYRNMDQPQHFYVAEIRHDLNPNSSFPSPELYKTFYEYYTTKYGLKISNMEQPLLDVDHTSARLNLLIPRYMNQKGVALPTSSAETKKARRENLQQKQILIPELCDVHVFPASLWRKAVCLPTVLYRMNYLLIAEEIRKNVSGQTGIGVQDLPEGYRFPQLDFGFDTSPDRLKGSDEGSQMTDNQTTASHGNKIADNITLASEDNQIADNKITALEDNQTAYIQTVESKENQTAESKNNQTTESKDNRTAKSKDNLTAKSKDNQTAEFKDNHSEASRDNQAMKEKDNKTAESKNNQIVEFKDKKMAEKVDKCSKYDRFPEQKEFVEDRITDRQRGTSDSSDKALVTTVYLKNDAEEDHVCAKTERCNIEKPLQHGKTCVPGRAGSDGTQSSSEKGVHVQYSLEKSNISAEEGNNKNIDSEEEIQDRATRECRDERHIRDRMSANSIKNSAITSNISLFQKQQVDGSETMETNSLQKATTYLSTEIHVSNEICDICCKITGKNGYLSLKDGESYCGTDGPCHEVFGTIDEKIPVSEDRYCSCQASNKVKHGQHKTDSKLSSTGLAAKFRCLSLEKDGSISIREEESLSSLSVDKEEIDDKKVLQSNAGKIGTQDTAEDEPSFEKQADVFQNMDYFMGSYKVRASQPKAADFNTTRNCKLTSMEEDTDLTKYIGPSPCTILQALTMSNANDFFSLERLETIGDSFLKYAITVYLYCMYPGIHEGKLSYLRSKQVSNYNLYRLGKKKGLAECMISTKFEPYENWLPPGFVINEDKRKGPVPKVLVVPPAGAASIAAFSSSSTSSAKSTPLSSSSSSSSYSPASPLSSSSNIIGINTEAVDIQKCDGSVSGSKVIEKQKADTSIKEEAEANRNAVFTSGSLELGNFSKEWEHVHLINETEECNKGDYPEEPEDLVPYCLQLHHSIPDKSIADCVEALIGSYLTSCGKMAALTFMSWLGLKVLPKKSVVSDAKNLTSQMNSEFERLQCPPSPLLTVTETAAEMLNHLLDGYKTFEERIGYTFNDKSYLLQAFTHASYHYNTITDCYQRLEFLGDAILDYVITRHLYEDSCKYSPGVLTDLRSALVNNNIFAALAVKWEFHKYFKAISPPLFHVMEKFVARQKEKEDEIDIEDEEEVMDKFMTQQEDEVNTEGYNNDDECEKVEMEVPKALGDIFESVAGAVYLDSGMSLDVVWRVYYSIMKPQIDKYLKSIPKSPVRELLEMEPEMAKFEKPERTVEGKIRVTVNVVGKGVFTGIGRNYRIAKSAAAKKALRCIKTLEQSGLI